MKRKGHSISESLAVSYARGSPFGAGRGYHPRGLFSMHDHPQQWGRLLPQGSVCPHTGACRILAQMGGLAPFNLLSAW